MCEENFFYNRSAPGCQQCPSCYSLVRDKVRSRRAAVGRGCCRVLTAAPPPQVNQQRQKLQELQTLIENLSSGQDSVSDQAFEDRLREAEKAIQELLEEAQGSKGESRPAWGAGSGAADPAGCLDLQMWTGPCWSG